MHEWEASLKYPPSRASLTPSQELVLGLTTLVEYVRTVLVMESMTTSMVDLVSVIEAAASMALNSSKSMYTNGNHTQSQLTDEN